MRERKMRDLKMRHQTAGVENAGLEIAGPKCMGGKSRTGKCRKRYCMERCTLLMCTQFCMKQALSRFKRAKTERYKAVVGKLNEFVSDFGPNQVIADFKDCCHTRSWVICSAPPWTARLISLDWTVGCCRWLGRRGRRRSIDSDQLQSAVSAPQAQDLCEVCLVQQRDARLAFVTCGHQRFCASCVAQLEQQARGCPICRTDINMVLRLY